MRLIAHHQILDIITNNPAGQEHLLPQDQEEALLNHMVGELELLVEVVEIGGQTELIQAVQVVREVMLLRGQELMSLGLVQELVMEQ